MSTFAVRLYEFGGDDEVFIGEDDRLWDWLTADNCTGNDIPHHWAGSLRVLAPDGYVFYDDVLVSVESEVALKARFDELSDWAYVSDRSPEEDKASFAILSPFRFLVPVKSETFLALELSEDRVLEITV